MNEKKYTQEEIREIMDGAIRKANLRSRRELSLDEAGNVSGGDIIIPQTHEEIDQLWDIIQSLRDIYGRDVAYMAAWEMHATAAPTAIRFEDYGTDYYRRTMHEMLDGKIKFDGGLDSYSAH